MESLKSVQTVDRMVMHKRQSKQKAGRLGVVKKSQDADVQNNEMQTIHSSQVLLLIQWLWVIITMRISFLSEPINNDNKNFFSELIINYSKNILLKQCREDDKEVNVEHTNQKNKIIVKTLFQSRIKMLA